MKACLVVPHFDHLAQFERCAAGLSRAGLPLIVVDDASPRPAAEALETLLRERFTDAELIRHDRNQGKGGAVMTGLRAALAAGYSHAVQIDADGQHDPRDVALMCAAAAARPDHLICGQPLFDQDVSPLRYYSRHITLYLAWAETISREIRDALCGLRSYPLQSIVPLIDGCARRMGFDPEILVRASWAGIPMEFVPIRVRYPPDGKSHFRYFRDNVEISLVHARLLLGMTMRLPMLIRQNRARRGRNRR